MGYIELSLEVGVTSPIEDADPSFSSPSSFGHESSSVSGNRISFKTQGTYDEDADGSFFCSLALTTPSSEWFFSRCGGRSGFAPSVMVFASRSSLVKASLSFLSSSILIALVS